MLTKKQEEVIRYIQYRTRYNLPTVQRDIAERFGIRRDSLNKLLARARKRLRQKGESLEMPPRSRDVRVGVATLSAFSER